MAQHDYIISNASGSAVRADINNVLQAILSINSGPAEPSSTSIGMLWGDTGNATTYYLKQRNHTNDAWVSLFAYNVSLKSIQPMANGLTLENYLKQVVEW